jgi:hypothetical protein
MTWCYQDMTLQETIKYSSVKTDGCTNETDENLEKYNTDEYNKLYWSVPTKVSICLLVTCNWRMYWHMFIGYASPTNILGRWPRPMPRTRVLYVPCLTDKHMSIRSSVNSWTYWFFYTDCLFWLSPRMESLQNKSKNTCIYHRSAQNIVFRYPSQVYRPQPIVITSPRKWEVSLCYVVGSSRVQNGIGEVVSHHSVVMWAWTLQDI